MGLIGSIAVFGAAISVFGVAYGIGKIGTSAMESIARQPESADKIQTAMIIASVFIEGAGMFGIVVSLLGLGI